MLRRLPYLTIMFLFMMTGASFSAPGELDPTFNGDGIVTYDSGIDDTGWGVAIQSDGKIVVVGGSYNGTNEYLKLLRYNSDGTLDDSFGVNGVVTYGNGIAFGNALAMQEDGKIVATGFESNGSNGDVLLLRFNGNGTLDTAFGTNGVVRYNGAANGDDEGNTVTIQADGKILVAGYTWNGFSNYDDLLVLRYNSDGTPDTAFGTNGAVTYNSTSNSTDSAESIAVQTDGKIIIAGYSTVVGGPSLLVLRYKSDGSLDDTFATHGVVTYGSYDQGYSSALQQDGKLVVTGMEVTGGKENLLMMRYNIDGTLDETFGTNGVALYGGGEGHGIAVQSDGKLVITGGSTLSDTPWVLRYTSDGTLDSTFNGNGVFIYNGNQSGARSLSLQSDGNIVVTGYVYGTNNFDMLVMRLIGHGPKITSNPGSANFGDVIVNSSDGATITVSNAGDLDLQIGEISLSGANAAEFGILDDNCSGQTLTSMASCTFRALFSPASIGSTNANITVSSNDPEMPLLSVPLTGKSISGYLPQILIEPLLGDFGDVTVGNSSTPQIFTFTNTGGSSLTIKTVIMKGVNPYQFIIQSNNCTGKTLLPFDVCTVAVTFTPASAGSKNANLSISSSDPETPLLRVPLIGVGTMNSYTGLTLLAPGRGERIPSGSQYTIRWGAPSKAVKFRLKYSNDNGLTWHLIADQVPGSSYDWTVPVPWNNNSNYLLRVSGFTASNTLVGIATSAAPFTVEVIRLVSPNGTQVWTSGTTHTISWTTNATRGDVATVKLSYTKDGGATWYLIEKLTGSEYLVQGSHSYSWIVPTVARIKGNCKVRVVLMDAAGKVLGKDDSDSYFTVQPGPLTEWAQTTVPGEFTLQRTDIDEATINIWVLSPITDAYVVLQRNVNYLVYPIGNTAGIQIVALPPEVTMPDLLFPYSFQIKYKLL